LSSIEIVDIIEGEKIQSGGVSYWNFYGVEVNNPGEESLKPLFRSQKLLPKKKARDYKFNGKGGLRNQRTSSRKK
jgi:hypothetical protein